MQVLAGRKDVPEEARRELRRMGAAIESHSLTEIVDSDIAFHCSLVDTLHSARLSRLYTSVMFEERLCMAQVQSRALLHPAVIAKEHASLLRAIEKGDADLAVGEITGHLTRARDRLIDYLKKNLPVAVTGGPGGPD